MTNSQVILLCVCLFLFLFLLGFLGIKASRMSRLSFSSSALPFTVMFSQNFLSPFSFKNDASAPDIVEAMEQVRIPASLCLKWAYGIPLVNRRLPR